ncbi:SAP30-binding protein-like [Neltuma alba]|uniref:SAP30-binding protein-like n=1 Tax=Neltuma alba TaxID=207710 RepID=UPI0010A54EDE|nr:SAP30-binding protein-like [Prosopis alba]XP_028769745.1 SAP30-binding protein-like [Prosopis alba]
MQVDAMAGSNGAEHEEIAQEEQKFVDPLDRFLPPPPKRKINKFLEYKKAGKSFNVAVRNRKDYQNPDFLLHARRYQDIDQIGSCFDKDELDPHRYDPSDYYDQVGA